MFQAYAVLLCATRDLKLASLAILAISVILTWVLATLVALGWSMNVVSEKGVSELISLPFLLFSVPKTLTALNRLRAWTWLSQLVSGHRCLLHTAISSPKVPLCFRHLCGLYLSSCPQLPPWCG